MQITVRIKLEPTKEQLCFLESTTKEYIRLVNEIIADFVEADACLRYTSKTVIAELPSALRNQAIRDAKSVFRKYTRSVRANAKLRPEEQKEVKVPLLRRPVAIWNNQDYSLENGMLSFPVLMDGKSRRIGLQAILTYYQTGIRFEQLSGIRQTARASHKNER